MSYLIDKYKGVYRLKVPYNKDTNMFERKLNGTFEDIDVYIDCYKDTKIFYYGNGTLDCYVPSLGRGRNIIKAICDKYDINISKYATNSSYDYDSLYKDKDLIKVVFDIYETDEEVCFKFKSGFMRELEPFLQPKTCGADISPFSSRNLPKSAYDIPDSDIEKYKSAVSKTDNILAVSHLTNQFIKDLATRKNPIDAIKTDMALKGLKGKNYIHSIGKWDEYVSFLEKNL